MRIYLAGGMRGYAFFNFPLFHAAAKRLREQGHEVFNPAEKDESEGFKPVHISDRHKPLAYFMTHDLPEVCKADAVAVLPKWHESQGARLEVYVARECGIQVLDALTLLPVSTVPDTQCQQAADAVDRILNTGAGFGDSEVLRSVSALLRRITND
jgi:putative NADPH-quinone reductase